MRDNQGNSSYLKLRSLHKYSGILLYLTVKAKLFIIHRIEDQDQVIFPSFSNGLQYTYAAYAGVLIIVWMIVVISYTSGAQRFRNKMIPETSKFFNSLEKSNHAKLIDLNSD